MCFPLPLVLKSLLSEVMGPCSYSCCLWKKKTKPPCDPTLTNCFQHLLCLSSLALLSKSVCWIWVESAKSFKSIKTTFSGGQTTCQKLFPGPAQDLLSATGQVFCLLATYLKLFGNTSYFLIAYKGVKWKNIFNLTNRLQISFYIVWIALKLTHIFLSDLSRQWMSQAFYPFYFIQ